MFKGFQDLQTTAIYIIWKKKRNNNQDSTEHKLPKWTSLRTLPMVPPLSWCCAASVCVARRVIYLHQNHKGTHCLFTRLKWHLVAFFPENSATAPGKLWLNSTHYWRHRKYSELCFKKVNRINHQCVQRLKKMVTYPQDNLGKEYTAK